MSTVATQIRPTIAPTQTSTDLDTLQRGLEAEILPHFLAAFAQSDNARREAWWAIGEIKKIASVRFTNENPDATETQIQTAVVAGLKAALIDVKLGWTPATEKPSAEALKAVRAPNRANVPSWAAHLPTQGTILEQPTALPLGRTTPVKVVAAPFTDRTYKRRATFCLFCSSPAKERGAEEYYDVCSECYKSAKSDVERDYVHAHPEASRETLRQIRTRAIVRLLDSKASLKTADLRRVAMEAAIALEADLDAEEMWDLRMTAGFIVMEALHGEHGTEAIRDAADLLEEDDDNTARALRADADRLEANATAKATQMLERSDEIERRIRNFPNAPHALSAIQPQLADQIRAAAEKAVSDYVLPHPEASDKELEGIQPFAVDRYKTAGAKAQRETTQYSLARDPQFNLAARYYATRRKRAEGNQAERLVPAPIDLSVALEIFTRTDLEIETRSGSYSDDGDYDGQFEDYEPRTEPVSYRPASAAADRERMNRRHSNSTLTLGADRTAFLSELSPDSLHLTNEAIDTDVHASAIAEMHLRNTAENVWTQLRRRQVRMSDAQRMEFLRERILAGKTTTITVQNSRQMPRMLRSVLSTLRTAVIGYGGPKVGFVRLKQAARIVRRDKDSLVIAPRAKQPALTNCPLGEIAAMPLYPRLRTPYSPKVGTDAEVFSWDSEMDTLLRKGTLGPTLGRAFSSIARERRSQILRSFTEQGGTYEQHAEQWDRSIDALKRQGKLDDMMRLALQPELAWAKANRKERLPSMEDDRLYVQMPLPEIAERRARQEIAAENRAEPIQRGSETSTGFALMPYTFTRIKEGEEVQETDTALVWTDGVLSNRAIWTRQQIERRRARPSQGRKVNPRVVRARGIRTIREQLHADMPRLLSTTAITRMALTPEEPAQLALAA